MRRLDFLDALRGLAAFGVVAYHLAFIPVPSLPLPEWLRPLVYFGGGGVTLFFIVSAFSLCLTMPRHEATGSPLLSFYTKRFFRIAPLFYAVLAFSVVRQHGWFGVPWPTAWQLKLNLLFLFNLVPDAADSLVFAGWTIGVEMLFYLVFPLLYARLSTTSRKLAALFVCLGLYPLFLGAIDSMMVDRAVRDRYSLLTIVLYLPAFAIGMLCFDLYRQARQRDRAGELGAVLIASGFCTSVFVAAGRLNDAILFQPHWVALGLGLMVLGVSLTGLPSAVARPAAFMGKISFSTYLLHGPLIMSANPLYGLIGRLPVSPLLCYLAALITTMALLVPLAWLTFLVIEQPGIAIGRQIVRRYVNAHWSRPSARL